MTDNNRVTKYIQISRIIMDRWALQPRTLDLIKHLQNGGTVPPIHVAKHKDKYKICDGRHRVTAYKLLGISNIKARFSNKDLYSITLIAGTWKEYKPKKKSNG